MNNSRREQSIDVFFAQMLILISLFMFFPARHATATAGNAFKSNGCLLVVDNYRYVSGRCQQSADEGQLIVSNGYYSGLVQFFKGDRAQGFWNGPFQDDDASQPLGAMVRDGDCWINKRSRICDFGRVHTTIGACDLTVGGVAYLKGSCPIETYRPTGSFYLDDNCMRTSGYAAAVQVDGANKATAYWSGTPPRASPDKSLGELHRDGACWENQNAKVCAYEGHPAAPATCKLPLDQIPDGEDDEKLRFDQYEPDGDCLLSVAGKSYMSGKCGVEIRDDSLIVTGAGMDAGYKALLTASDGRTDAAWNGSFGENRFSKKLGSLQQHGNCWEGTGNTSLCITYPVVAVECTEAKPPCRWRFQNQRLPDGGTK